MMRFLLFASAGVLLAILASCAPPGTETPSTGASYPTFSPVGGTAESPRHLTENQADDGVSITSNAGAAVYYTTDGTAPETSATGTTSLYNAAIPITGSVTIKAIATKGSSTSNVVSASYIVAAIEPFFSPAGGTSSDPVVLLGVQAAFGISLITEEAGASIYFTTDGTTPDPENAAQLYASSARPKILPGKATIKAIATKNGLAHSGVVSASYLLWPGSSWTTGGQLPIINPSEWRSVAFGTVGETPTFVAVANAVGGGVGGFPSVTAAASSTDNLATWTARTLPASSGWKSVTFGNGKFVAVADDSAAGTNTASAYSTDGASWTAGTTLSTSVPWQSVTYGNGKFVALGSTASATSTDGITWTAGVTALSPGNWTPVIYSDKFIALDAASSTVITSSDGSTWTSTSLSWTSAAPTSASWASMAYGSVNGTNTYVAFAPVSSAIPPAIAVASSPDGITWTRRLTSAAAQTITWSNVAYGNGAFLAISRTGQQAVSSDGIIWPSPPAGGSVFPWVSLIYGDGKFVAIATDGRNQRSP